MLTKTKKSLVKKLRTYLTLQLNAYHARDWKLYDELEGKIRKIESEL